MDQVYALASSDDAIAPKVKEALDVIDGAIDTHGQENISISFNGGKDCTVLLHLWAAALARRNQNESPIHIPALYISVPSPFPDLEQFIWETAKDYNLDLFHCRPPEEEYDARTVESVVTPGVPSASSTLGPRLGPHLHWSSWVGGDYLTNPPKAVGKSKGGEGMRQALQIYKDKHPNITGILIGRGGVIRMGVTKLSPRCPTDPDWPAFERINPIIDWGYADVWGFLRCRSLTPLRTGKEEGKGVGEEDTGKRRASRDKVLYTSLGSTYNTFPNPALLIPPSEDEDEPSWLSASEDDDDDDDEPETSLPTTASTSTSTSTSNTAPGSTSTSTSTSTSRGPLTSIPLPPPLPLPTEAQPQDLLSPTTVLSGYISSTHTRREGVDVSPSPSPLDMSSPSVDVEEVLRGTTTSGGVETGMGTQPSSMGTSGGTGSGTSGGTGSGTGTGMGTGTGNSTTKAKKGRRRPKTKQTPQTPRYKPAYELVDLHGELERAGRGTVNPAPAPATVKSASTSTSASTR
ncbi:hypothetical protein D9758_010008 [Tetrapyrgos nigripes]|uniref:FAD synthase n=1 Tax=Tetrapyrgos nigripes TaxID=182062 RepID=A0A8H5CVE3_9AGAR|nr:hypothetical protein D9758_010008 [Tetrapyrgos nigripes]